MSTSIIAFLLLTKFRTVSVVNCVLHLIVGLLQGVTFSQLAVEYKWMVQEAGSRGRWALFITLRVPFNQSTKRRCEYCGSPESAVKHALQYMTELVTTSPSPDGGQDQLTIEPILKLPTVMGLTHLSNQCVQVFLVESIIGEYVSTVSDIKCYYYIVIV